MTDPSLRLVERCRMCLGSSVTPFLDLGLQPPANALLAADELWKTEARYPLALASCGTCGLVQLTHIVAPEVLFEHYVYFSSVSMAMTTHFAAYARDVASRFVPQNGLVVEIGSNDGILLKSLLGTEVRILGVDPAKNVSEEARGLGVPTLTAYFGDDVAREILKEHGPASAIIANNVFAHIDDLDSVIRGVSALLADDGVFVIESPYAVDFLEGLQFDTVYHEHLSYLAVRPISSLLARFDMEVFEVQRQKVHGGSIRVFARKVGKAKAPPHASVETLLTLEARPDAMGPPRLARFAGQVRAPLNDLRMVVADLRKKGKRVVGYAAPAKATVLLNYAGFTCDDIAYLADATPAKQGRTCPGVRIPVVSPEHFQKDQPDYALLLAWNHEVEILAKETAFRKAGGRFIVPVPSLRVI